MPYGLASPSHYLPPICLSIFSICLLHLLLSRCCRFAASSADAAAAAAASVSPNFRTSQADREICRQRKFQVIRRRCGAGPTVDRAPQTRTSLRSSRRDADKQTISRDSRTSTIPAIREFTRYANCFKLRSSRIQYEEAKSLKRLTLLALSIYSN